MSDVNDNDIFETVSIVGNAINQQNNTISLTTGDATIGEVVGPTVQLWQTLGLASTPGLPEPGMGSAESLNLIRTKGDISIATRDLRTQAIYGNLAPGETCLYATGATPGTAPAQGRVLLKADGSINLMTTADTLAAGGNTPTANTAGGPAVMLRVATDSLTFVAPWGSLVFDQTGFHIQTVGGASFDLSNLSGLVPAYTSSCQINTSMTTINSQNIFLGPDVLSGGIGYFPAVFGILPPVTPFLPIQGQGVGEIVVQAASSQKIWVSA